MKRAFLLLLVISGLTAGCGGGEEISVDGQWARNSPMAADRGAVYMTIESNEGDRLLSASADASIAGTVEVHETTAEDDGSDEGMGMMMMREVEAIALPAGETVSLEPGGYHVMLIDLPQPLEIGQKFDLTLDFENYGEMVIEVEVMETAP